MFFQNLQMLPMLAPLLVVPVAIHLLNKKFPQLVLFSSVELIRRSMAQRSKLMRWRHLLLTLVRTLVVLLALLAFLQPFMAYLGQPPPVLNAKRHVVLVLDHSFSMEQADGLMSLRSRAGAEALRILNSLAAEDEMQIIAAGRTSAAGFSGWSHNHAAARSFITGLGPGYQHADFAKATDLAASLIRDLKSTAEVYFISDFQRSNWSDASFSALPKSTRVFFVPVGDAAAKRSNHAVTQTEIVSGSVLAGGEVTLMAHIANHSAEALDEPIEAVIDSRMTFEARVKAAPWSVQRVALQIRAPGPGWHTLVVRLKKSDALPLDDAFHLPLYVTEKEEVIIATDEAVSALTTRFLEAAINPYAGNAGSLLPRRIEASKLTSADLASTTKLVLTRVNALPSAQIRALADYMKAGGGTLWFLDGAFDADNARALSEWFTQPEAVPLRLTLRRDAAAAGTEGSQIARGMFDSRFLRLFRGSARESLAQLSFYELWQAAPVERADVLLTYADGTPALAHGSPGLGTLLMCNFSVAEIASNLARQRVFPAWIQEMTAQLSGERAVAARFEPGDMMDTEAWVREVQGTDFTSPSGALLTSNRAISGERVQISLPAREPGFYTLLDGRKRITSLLAANIAPEESDLRVLEGGIALQQAEQDAIGASQLSTGTDYHELARGTPIFHWFVWAVLIMLVLETLLQTKIRRTVA
jgi:von Willebrand factor type A domain/Aerotolerance regulator N-terminal